MILDVVAGPLRLLFVASSGSLIIRMLQWRMFWTTLAVPFNENVHFTVEVNDWEMDAISVLFSLLYDTSIGSDEVDKMVWIHTGN